MNLKIILSVFSLFGLFNVLYFVIPLIGLSNELTCKDEKGRSVDWYIVYKLPKIASEPSGSSLSSGKAYSYITSSDMGKWKLSTQEITSEKSIFGRTWQELKKKEKSASYLFYNDDSPEVFKGSAVGHLKGIVAFNDKSGFWLMHSIPRFGRIGEYEYPDNALTNGQNAICVTFKTSELNEICKQLLFSHPNIYLQKLTERVAASLDANAKSLFSKKPSFVRSAPFKSMRKMKSKNRQEFTSFAKDNQLAEDLFSDIIAPGLGNISLLAETWRRGVGTYMPPACQIDYRVINVESINMTVSTRGRDKSIFFKSTEDHSKWAISVNAGESWICMADMNRMVSQEKRGGGALCFQSSVVWKEFRNMISETDNCPVGK